MRLIAILSYQSVGAWKENCITLSWGIGFARKRDMRMIREQLKGNAMLRAIARNTLARPLRQYYRQTATQFAKHRLWKHLGDHLWWAETDVIATTIFGSKMLVNAKDECGRWVYYFGSYEPNISHWIAERLKPGDVFVDVGANCGYYTLLASPLVGDAGFVIAIEAIPSTYRLLVDNVRGNEVSNVFCAGVAAWHETAELEMFTSESVTVFSTAFQRQASERHLRKKCIVPAQPLSEILSDQQIRRARVFKMDIEGAEWNALLGLESEFPKMRSDAEFLVELTPSALWSQRVTVHDVVRFFSRFGKVPYLINNDRGAAAYFERREPLRPVRVDRLWDGPETRDVIFSNADCHQLSPGKSHGFEVAGVSAPAIS
jgi:FkbM family methyltransferase